MDVVCSNQHWRIKTRVFAWARRTGLLACIFASSNLYATELQKEPAENDVRTVQSIQQAATQGNVLAQVELGMMFANGDGVDRDDAQAVHWYRLAAEQGDAVAQFNLGSMYANGRGVAHNDAQAVHW